MKKTIFILIIFCIIFGNLNAVEKRRFEKPSLEYNPNATPHSHHGSSTDELFDLQFCFPVAVGDGEAGIECDGNYFYTTKMNGNAFYKYELDGTYIGEFTVDGCPGSIGDLAYDGQYFYGAAATNTVYEMDFDTQEVISTITAPIAVRGIAYDEVNDGFWANNWSDQITLFDRSGATLNSFPCGTFLNNYGIAWENTLPGGPYLWIYGSDDSIQNQLVQFDIATGLGTVNFDVSIATPLTGIPGGLYITDQIILGQWTIGGLCQNDVIWGLELANVSPFPPPTNVSVNPETWLLTWDPPGMDITRDHIGYNVYLDDMGIPLVTVGIDVFEYQYEGLVNGQDYIAGVSAVYDDPGESIIVEFPFTPVPPPILPPENLTAEIVNYNDVLLSWDPPGGASEILIDQQPNQVNGIFSDASYTQVLAENFILTEEVTIAQLVVWGGYFFTNIPNDPDYFTVIFHDDAAGIPGATISTEMDVPYVRVQTGIILFGVDEWMYTLTLVNPVTLAAGTYWVEFYNATWPAADAYFWETGYLDPVNGILGHAWSTWAPGIGWFFDGLSDMAMQLISGVNGDNIASSHTKKSKVIGNRVQEKAPVNNERVTISSMHPMMISDFSLRTNFTHRRRTNTVATDDLRILLGYKVYQDGEEIAYIEDPGTFANTIVGVEPGVHEYYVTAIYDEGESLPSNTASVEIILPIPQNVEAIFIYPDVYVIWVPVPNGRDFVSYSVYRDGEQIAIDITSAMYTDPGLPSGTYTYNVSAVFDGDWESDWSDDAVVEVVGTNNILIPVRTELTGNYPNPFNPTTIISYSLKENSKVSLIIYNIKGQKVKTLVNEVLPVGEHSAIWDGRDSNDKRASSGIYFYKLKSGDFEKTKKMLLMK